jgi:hypothetical protein
MGRRSVPNLGKCVDELIVGAHGVSGVLGRATEYINAYVLGKPRAR